MNAIRLSNCVSSAAVLLILSAYFLVASSKRTIIPNSSRISGSNLAAPRIRRSIASPISLPRAKEAPFATRVKEFNWSSLKPADTPTATALIACSAEMAFPVISFILSATIVRFLPASAPVCSKPSFSLLIASFLESKPKAAVNAKTLAASVA